MVHGCIRCIIHYDQNVMEIEVDCFTEASFSTIWRSAEEYCTVSWWYLQINRRILHSILMISARHFRSILIQRFTVVTSGAIVSSLISHGCWKENIDGENLRAREAWFHEFCSKSYLRRGDCHQVWIQEKQLKQHWRCNFRKSNFRRGCFNTPSTHPSCM